MLIPVTNSAPIKNCPGGQKVGIFSRTNIPGPVFSVFYFCKKLTFLTKKNDTFSRAKCFILTCSYITLDSFVTIHIKIFPAITTGNVLKIYSHFRHFFISKYLLFFAPKIPCYCIWIGLKFFLEIADISIYFFCSLNCLNSFKYIFSILDQEKAISSRNIFEEFSSVSQDTFLILKI